VKHRVVNVTEFKAKCLALLDDIGTRGSRITITKRGRPIATVAPAQGPAWKSPEGSWIGKLTVAPGLLERDRSDLWDVLDKNPRKRL